MRCADDSEWGVLQMPQLWGNKRLFLSCGYMRIHIWLLVKKLRTALRPQSSISWMSGKVPRGISTTPVYSFRHSSPWCFSSLLLSAPFPDIHVVACGDLYLPYFDAGAGAAVLGAGAEVLGAGADAAGAGVVFAAG